MRWTREELQELVRRGSPRGAVAVVGLLRTRPVLASGGQRCESVGFEHSSTAAAAKFPLCFLPSGRVTLGDVRSRSKCLRPCQGGLRTPSGPPQPACQLTRIPFPGLAIWVQLHHFLPLTTPVRLSSRKSDRVSPGAQDACAMAPAPPPGSAAGASWWAPQPRALPGRGAGLCGISSPGGREIRLGVSGRP